MQANKQQNLLHNLKSLTIS